MNKEQQKTKYFANKELLNEIRDEITIKRWKILSKSYKLGGRIWGSKFTKVRLAHDMDVPITTTLRCLALDKCNPRTWRMIKAGKISAFKVAMICMGKSVTYQDEIVDMVIADDLSTYQITNLKVKKVEDLNTERLRMATMKGFSRQDSAYRSFRMWITRGKLLLLMDEDKLPENKIKQLHSDLLTLKDSLERYLQ